MITRNELQYYSSLRSKKHRKIENKFIVEGEKTVFEGLTSNYKCEILFMTNKFIANNKLEIAERTKYIEKVVTLKQKEFEKLADTETPQGIAAVFAKPNLEFSISAFENEKLFVMLDNISDPGNLGTIIRNCDWFGVKNVLFSNNIVDHTNPKVIRASMGSLFHINIYENVDSDKVNELKSEGFEILCADIKGENIFKYKSNNKIVLILSSESHGPSEEVKKISDKKISVPKIGNAESLNVASASAVLLAQLTK